MTDEFEKTALEIRERFLPASPSYIASDDKGKFITINEAIAQALRSADAAGYERGIRDAEKSCYATAEEFEDTGRRGRKNGDQEIVHNSKVAATAARYCIGKISALSKKE